MQPQNNDGDDDVDDVDDDKSMPFEETTSSSRLQ